MVSEPEDIFPGLQGSGYQITSPKDDTYNCIAWAAGDTGTWWWPNPGPKQFWPAGARAEESLAAFQEAFATLGYSTCSGEELESDYEKIALFADAQGFPLHAAGQLPNGRWTSKLGELEDIEHALRNLEGVEYGSVVVILNRPLAGPEAKGGPDPAPAPAKSPPPGA